MDGQVQQHPQPVPRLKIRRRQRFTVSLLVLAPLFCAWFRRPLFEGNFGVVDPGRVYRSAQPNTRLAAWAEQYRLSSVLNLRGGTPSDSFYREEREIARNAGLRFFDVPLSATEQPSRSQMLALIEAIRQAPFPLLIHCKQGADRTGLATAVYRMIRLGVPPEEAIHSFQLQHAHVPLFGPEKLHLPLDQYSNWLQVKGLSHTPARFERWVQTEYVAPERLHHVRPNAEPEQAVRVGMDGMERKDESGRRRAGF